MPERAPITRQRSPWIEDEALEFDGVPTRTFSRRTGDGTLLAFVAEEPQGWHLSISFRNHRGEFSRYPSWDEIAHARDEHLPDDLDFVMFLPRAGDYIAVHDTTFHLHEHPPRDS
jgi:hypothetical protein